VSRVTRPAVILAAAVACALLFSGAANAAALPHFGPTTCTGGKIRSGSYASLRITGVCTLGNRAYVVVRGNVVVGHHGGLNAITMGHIGVWDDMIVRSGGSVGLGCSPAAGCSATTHDHIQGDVLASAPLAMIFHSNRIDGRIVQTGGGGGVNCNPVLFGGPAFSTYEDNRVGGNITVRWMRSCWFGLFRNQVGGTVRDLHNTFADPDANEVQTNTIAGDLICRGNNPAPQQGDSGGLLNIVAGMKIGQCNKPGI
jgi:hypothetical protein